MTIRDFLNIVFKRIRTFQLVLAGYFVAVIIGFCLTRASYTSTASLFVQSKTQEMSQLDKDNPTISRAIEITLADVLSEVEILLSEQLRYRVIDDLELADAPPSEPLVRLRPNDPAANRAMWASYLERNLSVEPAANASIIVVTFTDRDPERAATIVNGFSNSYLLFRMTLARQAPLLEQLRQERDGSFRDLQSARERLQSFDAQWDLVSAETQKDELLELQADIDAQVGELTATLSAAKSEIASFEAALERYEEGVRKIEPVRDDGNIQFLEDRLSGLEIELSNLLMHHTEKHSNVQRVRQNIEDVQSKLRAKTEAVIKSIIFTKQREADGIESELEIYQAMRSDIDQNLASIRNAEFESNALLMDMRMREDNFMMISKRLDHVRFDSVLGKSGRIDVIVTSKGFPPLQRSWPPPFAPTLLFALATAPLIALSIVFVLDHLDHTIREPQDIERHLGVPVLGAIRRAEPETLKSLIDRRAGVHASGPGESTDSP